MNDTTKLNKRTDHAVYKWHNQTYTGTNPPVYVCSKINGITKLTKVQIILCMCAVRLMAQPNQQGYKSSCICVLTVKWHNQTNKGRDNPACICSPINGTTKPTKVHITLKKCAVIIIVYPSQQRYISSCICVQSD